MDLPESLSLFRNKKIRILLLASLISASGSAMAPVALAFTVLGFDSRPGSLAIVLAGSTVPQLVLLLVGGVAADRFSRRRLIVIGNVVPALAQGGVALLVVWGAADTTRVALFAAVASGAAALAQPAMSSLPPLFVEAHRLQEANALLRLPTNVVRVLAPALGGVLVALVGPQLTLAWDAASFLIAALLYSRLEISGPVAAKGSALRDFHTGWTEFTQRFWLWSYTLSGTVVVALWLGGYALLGPVVAHDSGLGSAGWGTVQGSFAVGLVLGAVVSLRWKPSRIMIVCVAANLPLALPLVALALDAPLLVLAGCAALAGVGVDLAIVCWNTVMQQQLPGELLGRLNSFSSIGELAAVPLGYLLVGAAAASWGVTPVLLTGALLMTLATVALFAAPSLWSLRRAPATVPV
ncbi:MFS transporter [Streptomyces sp. G-G2]|uniref:MFS transporter n=1 Tax=Streptomyces sp. G-G2 TaxID=3046201 RepID=UPI0024BA3D0C|nr:MFS transporter [Streptomyces sp. G-G2]MDJ0386185.1 MFS transporter [Streptomyces sp. G-G2]